MIKKIKSSGMELKKPLNLTITAMLLALSVVLGFYGNISISFLGTNTLKISFSSIPVAIIAMLYGPIPAGIAGGLSDIISYIIAPMGAFVPGLTLDFILVGVIYGLFFYKEKITLPGIIIAELVVTIFIHIILASVWFKVYYGVPLETTLVTRSIKAIIDVPVRVIIYFFGHKVISRIPEFRRARRESDNS